jgi:hypothetical protein
MNLQPFKDWLKRNFLGIIYNHRKGAAMKQKLEGHLDRMEMQRPAILSAASFNIFTYHGEDGIIAYLLRKLKNIPPFFVDIGAGDCIIGNCSNLVTHYGWQGVFIDCNGQKLAIGKKFYKKQIDSGRDIRFIESEVTPENVNELLVAAGVPKEIGLLSLDIDGNDYWIWKAISVISPAIIIVESKVEFGLHDVIVPYGKRNHRDIEPMYNGASAKAFEKLAKMKGYKLTGANKQGYNLFFVKEKENIEAETVEKALSSQSAVSSFYPQGFFSEHEFIKE